MRVPRPHVTGIVAMAAAAGLSAWLVASHDNATFLPRVAARAVAPAATTTTDAAPGVDADTLRERARALGQPLYWAGARAGRRYELGRNAQTRGNVVSYLTESGDVELTVVTIPFADAFAATQQRAAGPDAVSNRLLDGGIAWSPRDRPTTAYVAHPGVEYVVEIDADTPGLARQLAFGGELQPVR